jgi:magnesium-transporting ATPase (P-type)
MGTTISSGKAVAGMSTERGKIASTMEEMEPEQTPLQKSICPS